MHCGLLPGLCARSRAGDSLLKLPTNDGQPLVVFKQRLRSACSSLSSMTYSKPHLSYLSQCRM